MTDSLLLPPGRRRTLYERLKGYFDYRTIAEMSIWFCIAAVAGFMFIAAPLAYLFACFGVVGLLTGPAVWLALLTWLWFSFARIARDWGPERLGARVFKYMQLIVLVVTFVTMLIHNTRFEEFNIRVWLVTLLAFDIVIMGMAVVFLLLAWYVRCRVPRPTYREILTMAALLSVQILLVT